MCVEATFGSTNALDAYTTPDAPSALKPDAVTVEVALADDDGFVGGWGGALEKAATQFSFFFMKEGGTIDY